ncbi:MAG: GTP-binding protein [Rhizobiaceae bacterium]
MTGIGRTLPVSILTGFLGAGKTSLLNRWARQGDLARTAIIINEFGEEGLDQLLLAEGSDEIVELAGGCICCSVRGDLPETLIRLAERDIDRIIVETSGLADPSPIAQAILAMQGGDHHFSLAGIITVVDAINGLSTLESQQEAGLQVVLADQILVTKTDLLEETSSELPDLLHSLDQLNAAAQTIILQGHAPAGPILAFSGPEHEGRKDVVPGECRTCGSHHHECDHESEHHHLDNVRSIIIRHASPLPPELVEMFCELLGSQYSSQLLRLKGLVNIAGSDRPMVFHGIRGYFHQPVFLDRWPDDDHDTRIVIITRDLDPAIAVELFSAFTNKIGIDRPDRDALLANPLAIPGHRA